MDMNRRKADYDVAAMFNIPQILPSLSFQVISEEQAILS